MGSENGKRGIGVSEYFQFFQPVLLRTEIEWQLGKMWNQNWLFRDVCMRMRVLQQEGAE